MAREVTDVIPEPARCDGEIHSSWPAYKVLPAGWHEVGRCGPDDGCLTYTNVVWVDRCPLGLRRQMERDRQGAAAMMRPAGPG